MEKGLRGKKGKGWWAASCPGQAGHREDGAPEGWGSREHDIRMLRGDSG